MVDAKVVGSSAMEASVPIAFQRFLPVAAKVVIVFGFLAVLRNLVKIVCHPAIHRFQFPDSLTFRAPNLWAGFVQKVIAAINARLGAVDRSCSFVRSHFSQPLHIVSGAKFFFADSARLLRGRGWGVNYFAFNAGFVFVRHSRYMQTVFAS
jgi:hypothetical protein